MNLLRVTVVFLLDFRQWTGQKSLLLGFEGATVGELIDLLSSQYPLRDRVVDEDRTKPYVRVFLNGRDIMLQDGLRTRLIEGDRVAFVHPFIECA